MATRQANKLTVAFVRTAKTGMHGDGAGLYLKVDKNGKKGWIFRFKIGTKQSDMGLGSVDVATLAEAREKAQEARRQLDRGINPLEKKKADVKVSFKDAVDRYLKVHGPTWRNEANELDWRYTLGKAHCASILNKDVASIRVQDVLRIVEPIWHTKPSVARRVRQRIARVLDTVKAGGYIADPWTNPAELAAVTLPKKRVVKTGHYRSTPYLMMPDVIARLRQRPGNVARLLEFLALTVVRYNEAAHCELSEFDLKKGDWNIPKERMKIIREHVVPLHPRAIELVKEMSKLGDRYIFPGRKPNTTLSIVGAGEMMRQVKAEGSPHGLRASFRTWSDEVALADFEVAETCLAHAVGNSTTRAYARSDLLERRRDLMRKWGEYITTPPTPKEIAVVEQNSEPQTLQTEN